MEKQKKYRLGELLVDGGFVSKLQLKEALYEQTKTGRRLGHIFIKRGITSEKCVFTLLAQQFGVPFVDLNEYEIDPTLVNLLPENIARRFKAIVISRNCDNQYLLGMSDPSNTFAYTEILHILQSKAIVVIVTETQLVAAMSRVYGRTEEIHDLAIELQKDLAGAYSLFDKHEVTEIAGSAPVAKLFQSILEEAYHIKASDIHIEPQDIWLKVRFRIDGEMHIRNKLNSRVGPAFVQHLKLMSGLDISEKRLPQNGRLSVKIGQDNVDIRVSIIPTQYGESVVMRLLVKSAGLLDLSTIGMPNDLLIRYQRMINRPYGMILVTGPTGSGKTTTLYASLAALSSPSNKIITIEDPIEYRLPGVSQIQVNEKIDLGFARVLRSTLRHDPDIILLGEMIDQETAQIGVRAALTGHLLLSTLHTNDAISTPTRLLDMGIPSYLLSSTILGIVAQRLVRTICNQCKAPYRPDVAQHAWLSREIGGSIENIPLRHGPGCAHCNMSGYRGRQAIYEVLEISLPLADALSRGHMTDFTQEAKKQLAGKTMKSHAVERVLAGETTIQEAMRISAQIDN